MCTNKSLYQEERKICLMSNNRWSFGGSLSGPCMAMSLKESYQAFKLGHIHFFMEQLDPGVLTKSNTEKGG